MDREYLKKSGLLEQYVLGLTNRRETQLVEKVLESDPEIQEDYKRLQEELSDYLQASGMEAPDDGDRPAKSPEDYEELDHEMIMKITEENQSLYLWRIGLSVVCLLLLSVSFFIYRQRELYRADLITEKAQHAQDQHSFGIELEHLQEGALDLTKLTTQEIPVEEGLILLHHLKNHDLALLDLSHLKALEEGYAYYIFLEGKRKAKPTLILQQTDLHHLHALNLGHDIETLKIFHWKADGSLPDSRPTEDLIAGLSLK